MNPHECAKKKENAMTSWILLLLLAGACVVLRACADAASRLPRTNDDVVFF